MCEGVGFTRVFNVLLINFSKKRNLKKTEKCYHLSNMGSDYIISG